MLYKMTFFFIVVVCYDVSWKKLKGEAAELVRSRLFLGLFHEHENGAVKSCSSDFTCSSSCLCSVFVGLPALNLFLSGGRSLDLLVIVDVCKNALLPPFKWVFVPNGFSACCLKKNTKISCVDWKHIFDYVNYWMHLARTNLVLLLFIAIFELMTICIWNLVIYKQLVKARKTK